MAHVPQRTVVHFKGLNRGAKLCLFLCSKTNYFLLVGLNNKIFKVKLLSIDPLCSCHSVEKRFSVTTLNFISVNREQGSD